MSHSNSHGFPHEKPVPRFIALRVSWNGSSSSGSGGPWGIPSCSQYSLARGDMGNQEDPRRSMETGSHGEIIGIHQHSQWIGERENLHRKPWVLHVFTIKYRVVLRILPSNPILWHSEILGISRFLHFSKNNRLTKPCSTDSTVCYFQNWTMCFAP